MLALSLVLEGASRTEAAQVAGMDQQTLRDWVHRFDEQGLAGLSDKAELIELSTSLAHDLADALREETRTDRKGLYRGDAIKRAE